MSQLLQLRDAVVAAVQSALPTFEVEGHLGRFSAADLSVFLTKAPAVRVAVLGVSDPVATGDEGDEIDCTVALGVYVVTKDEAAKLSRDTVALAAVERIVRLANGARWGLAFAHPAPPPAAQNLFNGDTLNKARALWGLDLRQPIQLWGEEPEPAPELKELFLGFAPKIGAAHVGDYFGPIPEAGDE